MRSCAIFGSTGLVGSALARRAVASGRYASIRAPVRKTSTTPVTGVDEVHIDFDALVADATSLQSSLAVDHVFCCLGTTIKTAGSREAFRRVDLDYPLAAARAALAAGARQYLIVTAVGADAKSAIFYNRVKGELEDALRDLEFPDGVTVLHPSLLLGERREARAGEAVASVFMRAAGPLFRGPLARYRAIHDGEVAAALLAAAANPTGGYRVFEGEALFALAR